MKKILTLAFFIALNNILLSQSSIQFKYINKFYDEINFEEYNNNKVKLSEFGNSIKLNTNNIREIDSVNIKSTIHFFSNGKKYTVLKFKKIGLNEKISFLCFQDNVQTELPYPYSIVLKLQGFFLMEFYSSEDNPKYTEINKLKPLVKDSDSILNIYKLADVIEKNKASLSKYLDQ